MRKWNRLYKELKTQVEDKKILEESIKGLQERIKYKIQKELGLKATSYSELKIECVKIDDRYTRVFSKIEALDKDLQKQKEELEIIEKTLNNIERLIGDMKDRDNFKDFWKK